MTGKRGARTRPVDLSEHFNWPRRASADPWWNALAMRVRTTYPAGEQQPWGIPFALGAGRGPRVVLVAKGKRDVTIPLTGRATFICFVHNWEQMPSDVHWDAPAEGLVVAEYELEYANGARHTQAVRARFELGMTESPGPPWVAVPFERYRAADPARPGGEEPWGLLQYGVHMGHAADLGTTSVYAMPNPFPGERMRALTIRGLSNSPLLVAGVTLYQGSAHPLEHLPRRSYRVVTPGKPRRVVRASVDLGEVARIERTIGRRGKAWLNEPGIGGSVPGWFEWVPQDSPSTRMQGEDLIEAYGAEDATVSVLLEGDRKPLRFSLGDAFREGKSTSGKAGLRVLGKRRQWMRVKVIDGSTGRPTPVRIHFSGSRGEYLAPHGHHSQINPNWFEDYGADALIRGMSYAYVPGEFTTEMPVGDVYVEISKGFEYRPLRTKVRIKPGETDLVLTIERWRDFRSRGWVTADTHVHFLSPHTAWLEAQAEGINVVNLLAAQLGRLFTNTADYQGRVGIVEDDTIVYVGTENRHHMMGHMSLLGTRGLPVYPLSCGGPPEAWVGDPEFMTMTEWAVETRRKGGLVIRPHFPGCGHTEDPIPILEGLVDALEIYGSLRGDDFPTQEWYRYLNCGYRVAVVAGTDKMQADMILGWMRTYAKLDPDRPFAYSTWAEAVRGGRTIATTGPVMDLSVEGYGIGDVIDLPTGGGGLEVQAVAESVWPLGKLELVHNGNVVARRDAPKGAGKLEIREKVKVAASGWIAARCSGLPRPAKSYVAAHTSPVYVRCGGARAFDGRAAQHMLALVEGGIEYLNTIASAFDGPSRKRMVRIFTEARKELKGRLVVEATHRPHSGSGSYHTHGHEVEPDHRH